jgi:hypothetical protein
LLRFLKRETLRALSVVIMIKKLHKVMTFWNAKSIVSTVFKYTASKYDKYEDESLLWYGAV